MSKVTLGVLNGELDSDNAGCNALTYTFLRKMVRIAGDLNWELDFILFIREFDAVSLYPELNSINIEFVPPAYKFRSVLKYLVQLKPGKIINFYKALNKCNLFFETSMGDSFSDLYNKSRPLNFCKFHRLINHYKKPLIFLPQTIGPFQNKVTRKKAVHSLIQAGAVYSRDPLTTEYLKELSPDIKIIETLDMAFSLGGPGRTIPVKGKSKKIIGLNPSALLWNGGYKQNNQFKLKGDYSELILEIVKMLLSQNFDVLLIPHVVYHSGIPLEDDSAVCRTIQRQYADCRITSNQRNPLEIRKNITECSHVIASRLHCCIASFSMGIPTFPLAYSRKFDGIFKGQFSYETGADLRNDSKVIIMERIRTFIDHPDQDLTLYGRKIDELNKQFDRHLTDHLMTYNEKRKIRV